MIRPTKDTGKQWLGNVPQEWKILPLGRIFEERREATNAVDAVPLSVTKRGVVDQLDDVAVSLDGAPKKLVREGDLVINSRSDRKGSSGLSPRDGSVSVINTVLHPVGVDPRYAHHLLRSAAFQEEFYRFGSGIVADLWTTRWTAMKSITMPVPPVAEQRLIADYLDRETAEIDAMAIELDQAMVLIDERFQAEVERCFNSLDAPHMPLRSQIQSMTTGTSVTAAKFAPAAGEPGVLATSAVFGHELDEAAVKSVDPHEYARLTCPLRVNTLLVSRMNTMNLVGKAVTVDRHLPDVYLPDRLWAVEVEVPRYVYWWTRSQSYREQIRGLAVGASDSMKTLSQQAFRGITLPVPPVPQQDAVAAQLDESAELTGALKSELQEAKVVLEERRAALISAAVTGQIDVTAQGVSAAEQLRDELEVHV